MMGKGMKWMDVAEDYGPQANRRAVCVCVSMYSSLIVRFRS